jgi:hypothetical protein
MPPDPAPASAVRVSPPGIGYCRIAPFGETILPCLSASNPNFAPTPHLHLLAAGRLGSPEYGMVAFLWWREEVADRDLNLVRDAGFTWVRQNLHWVDVELYKGGFDWRYSDRIVRQVQERGLNLLFRLHGLPRPGWVPLPDDPTLPVPVEDFADFCGAGRGPLPGTGACLPGLE